MKTKKRLRLVGPQGNLEDSEQKHGEGLLQDPPKTVNEPIVEGKLTKGFLMSLDEGLFLVSNVNDSPWEPSFAEHVASGSERAEQWARIVRTGTNRLTCRVFASVDDFLAVAREVKKNTEKSKRRQGKANHVWKWGKATARPLQGMKLKKKLFMSLEQGIFLATNEHDADGPRFGEYLAPLGEREKQWMKVFESGARGKTCFVFKTEADYYAYLDTFE